jgi:hypothetical protein
MVEHLASTSVALKGLAVQVVEVPIDLHHPDRTSAVTGVLVVTLEWVPINAAPMPPQPSPHIERLVATTRGDLFVRLLRAIDLPPFDQARATTAARVRLAAAGQVALSETVESLCPVWLQVRTVVGAAALTGGASGFLTCVCDKFEWQDARTIF